MLSLILSVRSTESLNILCKNEKLEQREMKRAACSKVPKLPSTAVGALDYSETARAGQLWEANTRSFSIMACTHTVGWKLTNLQGVGNANLSPARWRQRLNRVLLLRDVNFGLLDKSQTLCRA